MLYNIKQIIKKIILKNRYRNSYFSKDSKVAGDCIFAENTSLFGSNIKNVTLGRYSYIGKSTITNATIGAFCAIASDVKIGWGTHPTNFLSINPVFYSKSTRLKNKFSYEDCFSEYKRTLIGNDVWIGTSVWIKDGIRIGDGAIIAAGSIVTKDVEPYSIVGGNPARLIRYRFNEEIIDFLLKVQWWKWEEIKLRKNINFFQKDILNDDNILEKLTNVINNEENFQ